MRRAVPWYTWLCVLALTSAIVGVHWDISWHRSIGRDTFWTPAHIAIYLCGVLAGVAYGYLILWTSFSARAKLKSSSVRISVSEDRSAHSLGRGEESPCSPPRRLITGGMTRTGST